MKLFGIIHREPFPSPWVEGEKIPWDEPGFSQRMLREHLSQNHDLASRRFAAIDEHVAWMHQAMLSGESSRILDLGCGPGLYSSRLSRLGHECTGIDFSPASISYARGEAERDGLRCTYLQEDIRSVSYGTGYDLVMFIFGEFNVFRRSDAGAILDRAYDALVEGGLLILEVHTFEAVRKLGGHCWWYSTESGLFSEKPHICLYESFWDPEHKVTTQRYYIIDAISGEVTPQAASMQAYTEDEYEALLTSCGFVDFESYPSLKGVVDESQPEFIVLVARKEISHEPDPTDPLAS